MSVSDILSLIAIAICLVFSAIFSASDMAYSSVNKLRLSKKAFVGDEKAKKALHYAEDFDHTIAAILFGNDLVNILASSLASVVGAHLLSPLVGSAAASLIASGSLLFLLLVFGEISPKAIAKAHSYSLSRVLVGFMKVIEIVFFPFTYPTNKLAEKIAAPLLEKAQPESLLATDDELLAMVKDIEGEGIIDKDQSALIHRSIDFKETSCYEIMTPRVKVFAYDIETPFADLLKDKNAFIHSRIPVYKGNLDNVLGYIPVKTLLRVLVKGEKPDVGSLILPLVSVPRTMVISSTMALMKETHHHIAIVRDEFGGTEGVITLEDILEELVGEMWDESDTVEDDIAKTPKRNIYHVRGTTNIDDFFTFFHLDPDKLEDDFSTVNGFVSDHLGRFPLAGDKLSYGPIEIKVLAATDYCLTECEVHYFPRRAKKKP